MTTSIITGVIGWFLQIHYWYTRTSTAGISRLGTTLLAYDILMTATEQMFSSILRPEATGHWLTRVPPTYIFRLIPAFVMLKAAARLEFGWSTSTKDPSEKGWVPRIYLAKATHMERASDRVAARVPNRNKFAVRYSFISMRLTLAQPQGTSFLYPFSRSSIF